MNRLLGYLLLGDRSKNNMIMLLQVVVIDER